MFLACLWCGFIPHRFSRASIDLLFSRICRSSTLAQSIQSSTTIEKTMDYGAFCQALLEIAKIKFPNIQPTQAIQKLKIEIKQAKQRNKEKSEQK